MEKNNQRDVVIERTIQEFKQLVAENERLIGICEELINQYNYKIEGYKNNIKQSEEHLKALITAQYSIEEMNELKTEYNIKFPSAKISVSKDSIKMIKPEVDNCPPEYIKITKAVDWAEFKKNLKILNNQVIDMSTGEISDVKTQTVKGGEIKIKLF
jgi:hypothetical protein